MEVKNLILSEEELQARAREYQQAPLQQEEKSLRHLLLFSLEQQWYACSVEELKET